MQITNKKSFLSIIILAIFTLAIFTLRQGIGLAEEKKFTDGLTGYEIAKRSNERYVAHDEITEFYQVLINSRGEKRIRRFLRLRKNFPDHKRVTLKFISPEDIRDTGFLNHEKPNEEYDTQYLYLPAIERLRRISAANKEQRWVGSDFFFEDIQEIKFNGWNYQRLDDGTFDNEPCYVVEWTPKEVTNTVYGKQIYWYRKEGYLPARIDYYDKKNNLWKRSEALDFRLNQGLNWAWIVQMEDFKTNHKTENYRRWIYFDTNIPDDYFTTRGIEKNVANYSDLPGLWSIIDAPSDYDEKLKNY